MSDKFSVSSCYRIILAVLSSLRALLMHSLFQASAAVSREGGKASFVLGNPQKRFNCCEAFQQELSVTEMWKSPFSSFFSSTIRTKMYTEGCFDETVTLASFIFRGKEVVGNTQTDQFLWGLETQNKLYTVKFCCLICGAVRGTRILPTVAKGQRP